MKQSAPFSSDPRVYKYLFLFLLVAHLAPIWFFRYFPSQDGMVHVYNAYILKPYQNPALYKMREIFQLNWTIFPNWVSHLLMAGSMFVVPPLIAEKYYSPSVSLAYCWPSSIFSAVLIRQTTVTFGWDFSFPTIICYTWNSTTSLSVSPSFLSSLATGGVTG